MILLHVVSDSKTTIKEISHFLLSEKLIMEAAITNAKSFTLDHQNQLVEISKFMLLGKTKALLFDVIDKALRDRFGANLPEIYSTPIVNMDWEQASELKDTVSKV